MHRFLIVVEKAKKNFAAYSPDLPGCVATGKTREATTQNMYEAIALHIEGRTMLSETQHRCSMNAVIDRPG